MTESKPIYSIGTCDDWTEALKYKTISEACDEAKSIEHSIRDGLRWEIESLDHTGYLPSNAAFRHAIRLVHTETKEFVGWVTNIVLCDPEPEAKPTDDVPADPAASPINFEFRDARDVHAVRAAILFLVEKLDDGGAGATTSGAATMDQLIRIRGELEEAVREDAETQLLAELVWMPGLRLHFHAPTCTAYPDDDGEIALEQGREVTPDDFRDEVIESALPWERTLIHTLWQAKGWM